MPLLGRMSVAICILIVDLRITILDPETPRLAILPKKDPTTDVRSRFSLKGSSLSSLDGLGLLGSVVSASLRREIMDPSLARTSIISFPSAVAPLPLQW